jgi:hypothetical protein
MMTSAHQHFAKFKLIIMRSLSFLYELLLFVLFFFLSADRRFYPKAGLFLYFFIVNHPASKVHHTNYVPSLMFGKSATDSIEIRIENIFPMASVADPVVNDQLEDYISGVESAIGYILPACVLPFSITLNPVVHRAAVSASVPCLPFSPSISGMVQSGTKQSLAPLQGSQRFLIPQKLNGLLPSRLAFFCHHVDIPTDLILIIVYEFG